MAIFSAIMTISFPIMTILVQPRLVPVKANLFTAQNDYYQSDPDYLLCNHDYSHSNHKYFRPYLTMIIFSIPISLFSFSISQWLFQLWHSYMDHFPVNLAPAPLQPLLRLWKDICHTVIATIDQHIIMPSPPSIRHRGSRKESVHSTPVSFFLEHIEDILLRIIG